ncbi:MAG: 50S ribosomal protein L9 [Candidatus Omnitrophica bacterium]|nr:50S ribosomal protein L9 [Candidatus Omnitrophota bacterium]
MEIILREDVQKIGKAGDVIKVKDGYARNHLIPKNLALRVTPENLKVIEAQRKLKEQKAEAVKQKAQELAEKLSAVSCTVTMTAGEDDKLFGAVTNADIAEALQAEDILVDKKDITLEEEIHKLGIYYVNIKLHPEVSQRVKVWVVKK